MQEGLQHDTDAKDDDEPGLEAGGSDEGLEDKSRVKSMFLSHSREQIVLRSVANHQSSTSVFISALSALAPELSEAVEKQRDATLDGGTFFSFLQNIVIDGKINIRAQNSSTKVFSSWYLLENSAGLLRGCNLVWTVSNNFDTTQTVLIRGSQWQLDSCRLFCGGDCALRIENGDLESSSPLPHCIGLESVRSLLSQKTSSVSLVDCEIGGLDESDRNYKERQISHGYARSGIDIRGDSECVMQRCSIRGMERYGIKIVDYSGLHMEECEIVKR
eukprot:752567-Hanusia_phi.AAC.1